MNTENHLLIIVAGLALLMLAMASMTYATGWQPGDPIIINGDDDRTTTTVTTTHTPTPTTSTPTTAQTPTTVERVPFEPYATYESCERVRVGGTGVIYVAVVTERGVVDEWRGEALNESKVFETDTPIRETYVAGKSREASFMNEYADACFATSTPTPTPTTTRTPEPTPTPTTTTAAPTTTTATRTPEPTTTTTTLPPPTDHNLAVLDPEATLGTNATYEGRVWSTHEYTVELDFDVVYNKDRLGNMEAVDRIHLTIEPGEEVAFRSAYQGNKSIEEIEYAFNNLERVE